MKKILLKNCRIVNEGNIIHQDILIKNERIEKIADSISGDNAEIIDVDGKHVIPGIIDDQVHFRDPGLTRKANIYSESKAAVAGGVTSFMEMPNTIPNAITKELLEEKYLKAASESQANFSFYMGTSNSNSDEAVSIDPEKVCGIKIFMGGSTGNMLVDNSRALEKVFSEAPCLVAIHSENDPMIRQRSEQYKEKYGDDIPFSAHAEIRNEEVCYSNTKHAVELAQKHGTQLHILHLTTEDELEFFTNKIPLKDKKITGEICVHHLYFDSTDYNKLGSLIKCNPAIKAPHHKKALFEAMMDDRLDVIATDHAPHTLSEKQNNYWKAPAGIPLVQHSLNVMLDFYHKNMISLEKIVEKMCHAPAELFSVRDRGYIREGYYADLAVIDAERVWKVSKSNILAKCGWSPFEGTHFKGSVSSTFVNGKLKYDEGAFVSNEPGKRLLFDR